jgi:hypothetical protein
MPPFTETKILECGKVHRNINMTPLKSSQISQEKNHTFNEIEETSIQGIVSGETIISFSKCILNFKSMTV